MRTVLGLAALDMSVHLRDRMVVECLDGALSRLSDEFSHPDRRMPINGNYMGNPEAVQ